jgi:hypothetical protein
MSFTVPLPPPAHSFILVPAVINTHTRRPVQVQKFTVTVTGPGGPPPRTADAVTGTMAAVHAGADSELVRDLPGDLQNHDKHSTHTPHMWELWTRRRVVNKL